MLIDVSVLEHNDTWTEIHISKTFDDYTMPTTWLRTKFPHLEVGQILRNFDTQWLKMALGGHIEKDQPTGYEEAW